ncbi:MAG: methyltransferase domain-containing protein [bacterium]|nr:methyltransferase domain-containing protein [bacterium]
MRIAYFSPLHPVKSGISKYSEDLLPYLANHAEIDLYIDDYQPSSQKISSSFKIYPYTRYYKQMNEYDIALYHLGNNLYHRYMYPLTLTHPGITVLHDFHLFHLLAGITYVNWDSETFTRDMEINHGEAGKNAANRFIHGTFTELDKFLFSMNKEIIESSYGVVVHSDYYKRYITEHYPTKPVATIPMHIGGKSNSRLRGNDVIPAKAGTKSKLNLREKLGFTADQCIIISLGFIGVFKRIDVALRAVARLVQEFPNVRYVLVGESNKEYDVYCEIRNLHLENYVRVTEFVDEKTYNDYSNIADISINLRYPSAGETSLTLHQSFAAGISTLVSNYRQYAEYPDECCLKIDLSPNEEENLLAALRRLVSNEPFRKELGTNARKYVLENCTLDLVAREYIEFAEEVVQQKSNKTSISVQDRVPGIMQNLVNEINHLHLSPMQNEIIKETEIMVPERLANVQKGTVEPQPTFPMSNNITWNKAAEAVAKKYDPEMSIRIPLVWNWPPNMSGRFIYDFSVVALSLELPVNSLILDVAAGSCWVSEWLHQLGYRTISFDVSATQLKYGKRRFETNPRLYKEFSYGFVCADGERLPFPNASFDGIVCLNSFHHMPNFQNVLHELSRILKPNGRAVFSEPGAYHAESELSKREMQEFGTLEKSVKIDEVYQLALNAGFKKMAIKPIVYPDSIGYTYQQWKQIEAFHPELVNQFISHFTVNVRNTHPIFILYKSETVVYDSRFPNILKAEITLVQVPKQIKSGQPVNIIARIKNIGNTIWLHQLSQFGGYVTFGIKFTGLDGRLLQNVKQQQLAKDVYPDESIAMTVEAVITADPGKYALKFDMVDEQLCWFADCGSKEIYHPIEILPST